MVPIQHSVDSVVNLESMGARQVANQAFNQVNHPNLITRLGYILGFQMQIRSNKCSIRLVRIYKGRCWSGFSSLAVCLSRRSARSISKNRRKSLLIKFLVSPNFTATFEFYYGIRQRSRLQSLPGGPGLPAGCLRSFDEVQDNE
jgi:hypothetical protein